MDMMMVDGHDEAIVGVVTRFGQSPVLCYDYKKVIGTLVSGGMSEEEAVEYFDFNIEGVWVGEGTPCFIVLDDWRRYMEE
jgi:hypothetical protein|tara:strand:+ start:985 stop:1224 length:240 start_codon:yes stop_codon:yes gene_type:complete